MVLNFSEKDFAVGLSYVAVSRVKSIMFKSNFGMARFQARSSDSWQQATAQLGQGETGPTILTAHTAYRIGLAMLPLHVPFLFLSFFCYFNVRSVDANVVT